MIIREYIKQFGLGSRMPTSPPKVAWCINADKKGRFGELPLNKPPTPMGEWIIESIRAIFDGDDRFRQIV